MNSKHITVSKTKTTEGKNTRRKKKKKKRRKYRPNDNKVIIFQ